MGNLQAFVTRRGARGPQSVVISTIRRSTHLLTTVATVLMLLFTAPATADTRTSIWFPEDGDVLLIVADGLATAVQPFISDLSARGYHPSWTTLSLVQSQYPTLSAEAAMKAATIDVSAAFTKLPLALILVGNASEDTPSNNTLPTFHTEFTHEFPGQYDNTYMSDAVFGDIHGDSDVELLVGRIPVRDQNEMSSYLAKLAAYRSQPPNDELLLAVGDANMGDNNEEWADATAELISELTSWGSYLTADPLYASDYMPMGQTERTLARSDFLAALSQGRGLVEFFGNNTRRTNMCHYLNIPTSSLSPLTYPSDLQTSGKLPIVLWQTCLNAAADEDLAFGGHDSPIESWLRQPVTGIVAGIGQSHVSTFLEDWDFLRVFNKFCSRGYNNFPIGSLQAAAKTLLLRERQPGSREYHNVMESNLFGDPLIMPRLGIPEKRLAGSFEATGSWPFQNQLVWDNGWTTQDLDCSLGRVMYEGYLPQLCGSNAYPCATPIDGDRFFRVTGHHGVATGRRAAAWRVFSGSITITEHSVLSYWVKQLQDPRSVGRLMVDAKCSNGMMMSQVMVDSRGRQVNPQSYNYALNQWRHVFIRLGQWQGQQVTDIYLRYDDPIRPGLPPPVEMRDVPDWDPPVEGGTFAGLYDVISIQPNVASDIIIDSDFNVDQNHDSHPDYWYKPWPSCLQLVPTPALFIEDNPPFLWMGIDQGSQTGISQHIPYGVLSIARSICAMSPDGAQLRASLVDPANGSVLDQQIIGPVPNAWTWYDINLDIAVAKTMMFEMKPVNGSIALRPIEQQRAVPDSTSVASGSMRFRPAEHSAIRLHLEPEQEINTIEIFDVSGRRLDSYDRHLPGGQQSLWRPQHLGRNLPDGIYFVKARTSDGVVIRKLVIRK